MTKFYVIMDEIHVSQNAAVLIDLGTSYVIGCLSATSLDHMLVHTSAPAIDPTLGTEVALIQVGEEKRIYQVDLNSTTAMAHRTLEIHDLCHATDLNDLIETDNILRNIIMLGPPIFKVNLPEMQQWHHRDPQSLSIRIELLLFREIRILIEHLPTVIIMIVALSGMRNILVLSGVLVGHHQPE